MTQNPDVRSSGLTMLSGLRAGTHLGGYRLLRRLGAGGMGVVWEVVDGGGKHVAMKILHPQIAADPTARRRLDREASVLARVRDTRVARILDIETGDDEESGAGVTFVITELVDGPTLQHEVDHEGVYDLGTDARDLADLAHGLVTALRAVHDAGVIHRDLKPSNVMLGAQGPVLIDFGIAQVADDVRLTQTGQVTGTPGFIPPEMLDGGEPTPDVDWYACAGVLLFTVTGQAPFGSGAWQVVFRRVYAGTPELGSLPEECPALARAFTAALAPDAKDRISPDELVAVLDEIAEGGTGQEALDKVLGPEEELDEGSAGYGIVSGSDQASSASSPVSTAAASYGYVAGSGRPAASAPQPQTPPPSIPPRISPVASSGPPAALRAMPAPVAPVPSTPPHGLVPPQAANPHYTSPQPAAPPAGPAYTGPYSVMHPASTGPIHSGALAPPVSYAPGPAAAPQGALPAWAREPDRHPVVIAVLLLFITVLGVVAPFWVMIIMSGVVLLLGTAGRAQDARRWNRLERGSVAPGDTSRMWAAMPWYFLRSLVATFFAVIPAAIVAGVLLYVTLTQQATLFESMPVIPRIILMHIIWVAGYLGVLWLAPWNSPARRGGAQAVGLVASSPSSSRATVLLFLGLSALLLALEFTGQIPTPSLSPLS